MSRRGEQGEHLATSPVVSSRVLGRDRETASLLPLLTPGPTSTAQTGSVRATRTMACATRHLPSRQLEPA